jgi:hypothetical protein
MRDKPIVVVDGGQSVSEIARDSVRAGFGALVAQAVVFLFVLAIRGIACVIGILLFLAFLYWFVYGGFAALCRWL